MELDVFEEDDIWLVKSSTVVGGAPLSEPACLALFPKDAAIVSGVRWMLDVHLTQSSVLRKRW
ncbi:hypothetical protein TNCV_1140061 [Trichonephila clavipes]|nr:hypothetical protein TNCV_1140061 [Trichonephila clavipes]